MSYQTTKKRATLSGSDIQKCQIMNLYVGGPLFCGFGLQKTSFCQFWLARISNNGLPQYPKVDPTRFLIIKRTPDFLVFPASKEWTHDEVSFLAVLASKATKSTDFSVVQAPEYKKAKRLQSTRHGLVVILKARSRGSL